VIIDKITDRDLIRHSPITQTQTENIANEIYFSATELELFWKRYEQKQETLLYDRRGNFALIRFRCDPFQLHFRPYSPCILLTFGLRN